MKIIVIDGQGGSMGRIVVEQLKRRLPQQELIAIGTNSIATEAILRAGADRGASGENPVIVNVADADLIIGPIGLLAANALLGEVTPAMATAVGSARAWKVLIPAGRCRIRVAGVADLALGEFVQQAVDTVCALCADSAAAKKEENKDLA